MTTHVSAGTLRHKVYISALTDLLDSAGDVIQDQETGEVARAWVFIATPWAAILPLSGREFIAAKSTQSKVTGKMIIRFNASVNAGMRIEHNGKIYGIEAVLEDQDSGLEYITLLTSTGVSDTGQ